MAWGGVGWRGVGWGGVEWRGVGWMGGRAAIAGGATLCVCSFDRTTAELQSANLGDSGYSVYRAAKVVYTEAPQQVRAPCMFSPGGRSVPHADPACDALCKIHRV